jgi:hypothetical protein
LEWTFADLPFKISFIKTHGHAWNTGAEVEQPDRREKQETFLLGVGLDNSDGHVRLTKGDHFHLVGGSEQTHRKMQDKVMELTEDMAKRGKAIKDIGPNDFRRVSEIFRG